MRKFYIILTENNDYDSIYQEVVAWSDNPYVAISYFKEYNDIDANSTMVIYECISAVALSQILRENYNTEMSVILSTHLVTKTSINGRCYVIYREQYSELFTVDYLKKHSDFICDYICKVMLHTIPLIKYFIPEYNEIISSLLFIVYTYTSIKKMIRTGVLTDLEKAIDMVYFWRFVNYMNPDQMIQMGSGFINPTAAVFIDSERTSRWYENEAKTKKIL